MTKIACETCVYWSKGLPPRRQEGVTSYGFQDDPDPVVVTGQCRRFPPFMVRGDKGPRANWPITLSTHWCREHGDVKREEAGR